MKRQEDAYALIVVLWSILILTIIFVNLIDEAKLNNLLVRNNIANKELHQAAVNGVQKGINDLENDKTVSDTSKDEWVETKRYEMSKDLTCQVEISDIGSKLNINYSSEKLLRGLQEEFEWKKIKWDKLADRLAWEQELSSADREEKIGLVANLKMFKSEFESKKDYQLFKELFTTYGQFNINVHNGESLRKLLYFLKEKSDLYQLNQKRIANVVKALDKQGNSGSKKVNGADDNLDLVKNFLEQAFPTRSTLRKKIKPYLTVNSRININFVNQKVLQVLLKKIAKDGSSGKYKKTAQKIVDYCADNKVEKLSKLNTIGVGLIAKELEDYVATHSTYLLIEATAFNNVTQQEKKVKVVVKKIIKDKDEFKLQVIDWWEN
ncbi:hypothetical protein [Sporohalobacter salinus]|uniref:hypothetical protein n=1 Tax=Sporohalobacter salinus TaxID=1494606 RepID=UPI00196179D2|nr:hypothetical protein [Sporohalobacter salinus]MBM7623779.1 general secretion pathway protein K [Sporohalobacter salinus]